MSDREQYLRHQVALEIEAYLMDGWIFLSQPYNKGNKSRWQLYLPSKAKYMMIVLDENTSSVTVYVNGALKKRIY